MPSSRKPCPSSDEESPSSAESVCPAPSSRCDKQPKKCEKVNKCPPPVVPKKGCKCPSISSKDQSAVQECLIRSDSKKSTLKGAVIPQLPLRRPERYSPKPYTFRIPLPSGESKNEVVRSPPFHLQLDHALAVIWCLFSKEDAERPLGIVQMQWALNFLKGIYNRKGEHPKDVEVCIQACQDQLIDQYASMIEEVPIEKYKNTLCGYDCSSRRRGSCEGNVSSNSLNRLPSCASSVFGKPVISSSDCTSTKVPFSINYAEMVKRNPAGLTQLFKAKDGNLTHPNITSLNLMCSEELELDSTKSKEFLQVIRQEQIDKIQAELKTLHLIEDFISKAQSNGGSTCDPCDLSALQSNTTFNSTRNESQCSSKGRSSRGSHRRNDSNCSRKTERSCERQSERACPKQGQRTPGRQCDRTPRRQSDRSPGRQCDRTPGRQSDRTSGRQCNRTPGRQGSGTPERRSDSPCRRQGVRTCERRNERNDDSQSERSKCCDRSNERRTPCNKRDRS